MTHSTDFLLRNISIYDVERILVSKIFIGFIHAHAYSSLNLETKIVSSTHVLKNKVKQLSALEHVCGVIRIRSNVLSSGSTSLLIPRQFEAEGVLKRLA